jgi:hypothetical protein
MCVVCILWNKEKLSRDEALSALVELVNTEDVDKKHLEEVYYEIAGSE